MAIRRVSLLIMGMAGSVFAATLLYCSAMHQYVACSSIKTEFPSSDSLFWGDLEKVTVLEPADIVLPVVIPGTTLLAKELSSYDGPFVEDGTDREVVGTAALLVENFGKEEILRAQVRFRWGERHLTFLGERIPPGETVLLLEQTAKPSLQKNFTACDGWQLCSQEENQLLKQILVSDRAMGTVIVTNKTESPLKNICLYYKSWLSARNILIGGIAYSIVIPYLGPGQSTNLYPPHYASGYSRVVSVHTDMEWQ